MIMKKNNIFDMIIIVLLLTLYIEETFSIYIAILKHLFSLYLKDPPISQEGRNTLAGTRFPSFVV